MGYKSKSDVKRRVSFPNRDEKLAELIGILTGDGFINEYKNRNSYSLEIAGNKIKDREYLERFVFDLIKNSFKIEPSIILRKDQNTMYLVVRSKGIYNFIVDCGFPSGRKSDIGIPEWIKNNDLFLSKFIRGVFDTDGYITLKNKEGKKYPVLGISSKSEILLNEIGTYLNKLTISYYIGSHINKSREYKNKIVDYKLQVSGKKNIRLFFEFIGSNNIRNRIKYHEMEVLGVEPRTPRASVVCSPAELYLLND